MRAHEVTFTFILPHCLCYRFIIVIICVPWNPYLIAPLGAIESDMSSPSKAMTSPLAKPHGTLNSSYQLQHSTHIKRNTQPISKGTLNPYQKEHSYYQKEYSSWNTQLIKRNTHIIKRNSLKGTLILLKETH